MTNTAGLCPFSIAGLPVEHERIASWEQVRSIGPVFQLGDDWFVTSSDACRFVTRNPQIFSSATHGETLNAPSPYIPGGIDPPEHLRYRQVIDRMFAPKAIAPLEPDFRRRVNELIDVFIGTGECEIMSDLADVFPAEVFMRIFGLPLADREQLAEWTHATLVSRYSTDGDEPASKAKDDLYAYIDRLIETKRRKPGNDFISYVIGQGWSYEELMGVSFNLIQGGLDTLSGAIGLAFFHLAKDTELRRQAITDEGKLPVIIDELLRLDTPVPFSNRTTTQEVEVAGVTIPAGAHVVVCYGAANLDPQVFRNPHDIVLDPERRRDLYTFGGGTHRCLGSHLARLELRIVLEEFHARIPDYALAADSSPAAHWPSVVVRLDQVPLVFPAGGAA